MKAIDREDEAKILGSAVGALRRVMCLVVGSIFVVSQSAFADVFLVPKQKKLSEPSPTVQSGVSPLSPGSLLGGTAGSGSDRVWRIKPGFKFDSSFDTNINRERPGRRDEDIILTYAPSIKVMRHGTRVGVEGNYTFAFQQFLRDSDQSHFDHTFDGRIKYTGNRLNATLGGNSAFVETYASSEQSERRSLWINGVSPEIAYRLTPKLSASALYRNHYFDYRDVTFSDLSYWSHDTGGRIYYHATPKLDFYTEGVWTVIDYWRSGVYDADGFSATGGAVGRMTPKLVVDLGAGFKGHFYDNSTINSYKDWIVLGSLGYRLSPKIDLSLYGKRDKNESVYRNVGWFRSHELGLGITYRMPYRTTFGISGSIQNNRYSRETTEGPDTKKRSDFIYAGGSSLSWSPIEYVSLAVGYGIRKRTTNFDDLFGYLAHSFDGSVSCSFG